MVCPYTDSCLSHYYCTTVRTGLYDVPMNEDEVFPQKNLFVFPCARMQRLISVHKI